MHPFLDGNGRTARALEAFMLQKAGLKDSLFIAMSNYYYEEKTTYLGKLAEVRASNHDLTQFLVFGLNGIEKQCSRLFSEIKKNVSKALYVNLMSDLFNRLKSERKRVIQDRQKEVLELLLESEQMMLPEVAAKTTKVYAKLTSPHKALIRDLNELINLRAIEAEKVGDDFRIKINLQWPMQMTDTDFFKQLRALPKAKTQLISTG